MSFVKPEETVEREPAADAKVSEAARFYADVANGLHAVAQPLTILRSTMVACALPGLPDEDRRRYMDISAEQVERACGLFQTLQQMVLASQMEAYCTQLDLADLLASVLEDQKALLDGSGVDIKVTRPDHLPLLLADRSRTLQALFAVLKIAASTSSPGDVVDLQISQRNGSVELTIQSGPGAGKRLDSSNRLSLSLAEVNIRSQRGEFEVSEGPFRVSFTLPVGDLGPVKGRVVSHPVLTHQLH